VDRHAILPQPSVTDDIAYIKSRTQNISNSSEATMETTIQARQRGNVTLPAELRERILLQRAGAHYRFIHRTFQEYVAGLTDERIAELTQN
jgi:hypothetical protein